MKIMRPLPTKYQVLKRLNWLFPSKVAYVKFIYRYKMGKRLDLVNPQSFNEKLQWLKLYDNYERYHNMVDKFEAKKYVASIIGDQYIIPTLGVWNNVSELDWEMLPSQFVIKATHGGGGGSVFICKDKNAIDKKNVLNKLRSHLKKVDLYKANAEYVYGRVAHRILAENFLDDGSGGVKDYKFFCFNGKVKFCKVDFGRFSEHHANYYDNDWNLQPFGEEICPPIFDHVENKPENLEEMIIIAEKLSADIPFLRVDLYNVGGKIFFGELTFYPASGFGKFCPSEYDYKLGALLCLPKK